MRKEIYLAGGCFWGLEKYLGLVRGVLSTEAGYAESSIENPSYEQVCTGLTHAAETVRVQYDDSTISLSELLAYFFHAIDPTSVNRQGNDVGTQYRTGIYTVNAADLEKARDFIRARQRRFSDPIAVEVKPLENFYRAEEHHQKYLDKHPQGYCHIGREAFDYARGNKISKA